jgi:hypothetical protein
MLKGIPANRVAAISTWLAAFAAFILGVVQILPSGWQNYALIGSGLLVKVATTIKFLDGSQKWDALTIGQMLKEIEAPIKSSTPIALYDQEAPPMQMSMLEPVMSDELEAGPPDDAYEQLDSQQWLKNRASTATQPATQTRTPVPPRPTAAKK